MRAISVGIRDSRRATHQLSVRTEFKAFAKSDRTLLGGQTSGVKDCVPCISFEVDHESRRRTGAYFSLGSGDVSIQLCDEISAPRGERKQDERTCSA